MYAIEARKEKGKQWIFGIFKSRIDAERYFSTIPAGLRSRQSLKEIPFANYPFFVIEKCGPEKDGFQYLDFEGVKAALTALRPIGTGDTELIIIFVLTEDFFSPEAGTDYMGILDHYHITNQSLGRKQHAFYLRYFRKVVAKGRRTRDRDRKRELALRKS